MFPAKVLDCLWCAISRKSESFLDPINLVLVLSPESETGENPNRCVNHRSSNDVTISTMHWFLVTWVSDYSAAPKVVSNSV
jgi:hypothetical protein